MNLELTASRVAALKGVATLWPETPFFTRPAFLGALQFIYQLKQNILISITQYLQSLIYIDINLAVNHEIMNTNRYLPMKNTYTNAEVEAHKAKATAILLKIMLF